MTSGTRSTGKTETQEPSGDGERRSFAQGLPTLRLRIAGGILFFSGLLNLVLGVSSILPFGLLSGAGVDGVTALIGALLLSLWWVFRSGGSRSLIALALAAPILALIGLIGGASSLSLGVGLSVGLVVRFFFAVGVLQAMPVLTSRSLWLIPSALAVIAVIAVFALLMLGPAVTAEDVGSVGSATPTEMQTTLTTASGAQG